MEHGPLADYSVIAYTEPFLSRTLTQHVGGVELQDQPAVSLVGVGAKDREDGALLARLRQQLVDIHLPLGELEVGPGLPFVGAEPGSDREGYVHVVYIIIIVVASEPHYCDHASFFFCILPPHNQ